MAYPVDAPYEARTSEVTTVKKAWADAIDAQLNKLFGGTSSVKALSVDIFGDQPATASAGQIVATGSITSLSDVVSTLGNIHAGNGNIYTSLGHIQAADYVSAGTYATTLFYASTAGGVPTFVAGAHGGTSSGTVTGTDMAGQITINCAGGGQASGFVIAFHFFQQPLPFAPHSVIIAPADDATASANLGFFAQGSSVGANGFDIHVVTAMTAGITYKLSYIVGG